MAEQRVRLYYREGCHLCEEMAAGLFGDWPEIAAQMEWCDVDSRPAWRDRFGDRVPVLSFGDQVVCEYFLDPDRMHVHFGCSPNPL